MKERRKIPGQPDVLRNKDGEALLCGYLELQPNDFYCRALEQNLKKSLSPKQSDKCPVKNIRSKACEVLKPHIHGKGT